MLTKTEFEPIIAAVPSFRTKWLQREKQGRLCGPIPVDFSLYMTEHLIECAERDDVSDFTLLFQALEGPLSDRTTELYDSLTMGFLEDLINECERRFIKLDRVEHCIGSTVVRQEWNWAYNYTRAGKDAGGGPTR
jgi:hypothetical protein